MGSLGASLLVGTQRLGTWFAVGVVLWGLPVTLMGVVPYRLAALGLLACVGVGNALIDLSGFTLLARLASDAVLARVFGVLESMVALSIGLGALAASLTVDWFGIRPTLVVVGLLCPVSAVVCWRRLRRMDRSIGVRDRDITLLRMVAMLHPLPLPSIEQLARGLEPVDVSAGQAVFTQGEAGDRYYVIESGEAEVVRDGRIVATLLRGNGFGEIALLRPTGHCASRQRSPAESPSLRPLPASGARLHAERASGRGGDRLHAQRVVAELGHRAAARAVALGLSSREGSACPPRPRSLISEIGGHPDKTCLADTSFSTHQYQRGLTNPRRRGRPFELTPPVVTSDHR